MALWPFGKNKNDPTKGGEATNTPEIGNIDAQDVASAPEVELAADVEDALNGQGLPADPEHDAIDGSMGPYDGRSVKFEDFDFSDFGTGVLNLGSIVLPLPHHSEVQVEMGPNGPKMLHVLTEYGRVTPVAFAAPASKGQWREATKDIAQSMRNDGLDVEIQYGPWGREIVGSMASGGGIVRIIGVDGPRWMLRMTVASPKEKAEEMTRLARELTARTFVYRDDSPILAGNSLPVALPEPLAKQVQQEMIRRQKAAQESAQGQPQHATEPKQEQ